MVPASAVQKDVHETEDEEAADSTPAGSATFFLEINHEIFSLVILSLLLIQEEHLSVSGKRMCTILANCLEDLACPVKVWLGKMTALDIGLTGP